MSFQAMAWAVALKLPTRQKFVLLMLATYASNDEGKCYPSLNRLSEDTGMSRHTVIAAIKALEGAGALRVIRREQGGVNLPNIYQLNLAWRGGAAVAPPVQLTPPGSAGAAPEPVKGEPVREKKPPTPKVDLHQDEGSGLYTLSVPEPILKGYLKAYPGVDVASEIARAESWINDNLSRKPSGSGGRFLSAWLNRAHRDARASALSLTSRSSRATGKQADRDHMNAWLFPKPRDRMAAWLYADQAQPKQETGSVIDVVATEVPPAQP